MNIESLTIGEARQIASMLGTAGANPCPFKVGAAYYIRTVTMHWTGRVVRVVGDFLVMEDAAWIADGGRYHESANGKLNEVEPVQGEVFIGLGAVVDACEFRAELPRKAK